MEAVRSNDIDAIKGLLNGLSLDVRLEIFMAR